MCEDIQGIHQDGIEKGKIEGKVLANMECGADMDIEEIYEHMQSVLA